MQEIWKDIKGYEGYYQVSNLGRVKSLKRKASLGRGYYRIITNRIMRIHKNNYGYEKISLSKNGKDKECSVHGLVAKTFLTNPENKRTINHIDGNKVNNHVSNLEYATDKENIAHAIRTGLTDRYFLRDNRYVDKIVSQYTLQGEFIKKYDTQLQAQKFTGIHNSAISRVRRGKAKSAGGYLWK